MQNQEKPVKVYHLQNQRKKRQSNKDEYLKMCIRVAAHFPQYTINQVSEELPFRLVKAMYEEIEAEKAEFLLLLNGVVNGPNEQGKQKKSYKSTINELIDLANK